MTAKDTTLPLDVPAHVDSIPGDASGPLGGMAGSTPFRPGFARPPGSVASEARGPGMPTQRDSNTDASKVGEVDINLFAGAGGLAIGLVEAGFSPSYYYEIDKHACETLRHNIEAKAATLSGTVEEGDVRDVDWGELSHSVRLLAGGVPCQPFSLAGKHKAQDDDRNCFPDALRAIRELRPAVFLLENATCPSCPLAMGIVTIPDAPLSLSMFSTALDVIIVRTLDIMRNATTAHITAPPTATPMVMNQGMPKRLCTHDR